MLNIKMYITKTILQDIVKVEASSKSKAYQWDLCDVSFMCACEHLKNKI